MIDRRLFIVGSLSVVCATQLPRINLIDYHQDIDDVIAMGHDKMLNAKYMGDWLYIFEEDMEKKMKEWGTYQPLKEILWHSSEPELHGKGSGIWNNPNFFDECHFAGTVEWDGDKCSLDGFTTSFKLPNWNIVTARYHWYDKKFDIVEKNV